MTGDSNKSESPPPQDPSPSSGGKRKSKPRKSTRPCPKDEDFNDDHHTRWLRDEIKRTPRCDICNMKCAYPCAYSVVCNFRKCRRRICQRCYEGDRDEERPSDPRAVNMIDEGCWCQYTDAPGSARNGIHPAFKNYIHKPTKQFAEDVKNLHIQRTGKKRAAQHAANREASNKKQARGSNKNGADSLHQSARGQQEDDWEMTDENSLREFYNNSPIQPTLTSERPHRRNAFMRRIVESSDEEAQESDAEQETAAAGSSICDIDRLLGATSAVLDESAANKQRTTVVIGGGVAGLCIALELAKRANKSQHNDKVIVVEREEDIFPHASGRCTGLITSHGLPRDVREAGGAQIAAAWDELRLSPGFDSVGWKESALFRLYQTGETNEYWKLSHTTDEKVHSVQPPVWLKRSDPGFLEIFATDRGMSLARLKSRELGQWLKDICETYGVEFLFGRKVTRYADGGLVAVNTRTTKIEHVECNNVVVAAGPWSKQVLDKLYPQNLLTFTGRQYAAEWLLLEDQAIDGDMAIAALKGASSVPELDPMITIVAHGENQDILLSAAQSEDMPHGYPKVHESDRLDKGNEPTHLPPLALRYITGAENVHKSLVSAGREFICTAYDEEPALSALSPLDLSRDRSAAKDHNVWLAFGFGNHGTTLAPLIGKIMGGLVYGEDFYGHPLVNRPHIRKVSSGGDGNEDDMDDASEYRPTAVESAPFISTQSPMRDEEGDDYDMDDASEYRPSAAESAPPIATPSPVHHGEGEEKQVDGLGNPDVSVSI